MSLALKNRQVTVFLLNWSIFAWESSIFWLKIVIFMRKIVNFWPRTVIFASEFLKIEFWRQKVLNSNVRISYFSDFVEMPKPEIFSADFQQMTHFIGGYQKSRSTVLFVHFVSFNWKIYLDLFILKSKNRKLQKIFDKKKTRKRKHTPKWLWKLSRQLEELEEKGRSQKVGGA